MLHLLYSQYTFFLFMENKKKIDGIRRKKGIYIHVYIYMEPHFQARKRSKEIVFSTITSDFLASKFTESQERLLVESNRMFVHYSIFNLVLSFQIHRSYLLLI